MAGDTTEALCWQKRPCNMSTYRRNLGRKNTDAPQIGTPSPAAIRKISAIRKRKGFASCRIFVERNNCARARVSLVNSVSYVNLKNIVAG